MQKLLQTLSGAEIFGKNCSISRQAVSKACRKFPYPTFAALQKQAVDTFYQQAHTPRWMGFRLVGVDGSKVRLPATGTMAGAFGEQGSGKQSRPMALLMGHYDVLAGIPLSGELSPSFMGERFLAERLLNERQTDDLLLYDRGFPSFALFALHHARQVQVCMRLPRNYHPAVQQFIADGVVEREVIFEPTHKQKKACQLLKVEAAPLALRLVRVKLKSGDIEVLATSLRDTKQYPVHLFKDLYAKRWAIEEGFKALKSWALLETFRTKEVAAVYQEVYARLLMLTLSAMAGALVQPQVDQMMAHRQQAYKVNVLALLRKFRDSLYTLWRHLHQLTLFEQFMEWVADDANAIRPGRSFERKSKNISPLPGMGA